MVAVLVGQENAVEFVRGKPAEREPEEELARAQAAIDEQPAMIGRDQRAIARASAAEHGQTEHARYLANGSAGHKQKPAAICRLREQFSTVIATSDTVSIRWMRSIWLG